jgi:hypothetical protein
VYKKYMSFNKKYLPELKELKEYLDQYPENLRHYFNADALIGPEESIKYIDHLWKLQEKAKLKQSNEE